MKYDTLLLEGHKQVVTYILSYFIYNIIEFL